MIVSMKCSGNQWGQMKSKVIVYGLILTGIFATFKLIDFNNKSVSCIGVYVDFNNLDNNRRIIECVPESGKTNALQILSKADIKVDGTIKYGNAVACRVNSLPGPDVEPCSTMPPENAYWAIIVKKSKTISDPFPKWGWAKTGISDVYLYPGESIGLVYTKDGKVNWPD